jgi:hypothetical protein
MAKVPPALEALLVMPTSNLIMHNNEDKYSITEEEIKRADAVSCAYWAAPNICFFVSLCNMRAE